MKRRTGWRLIQCDTTTERDMTSRRVNRLVAEGKASSGRLPGPRHGHTITAVPPPVVVSHNAIRAPAAASTADGDGYGDRVVPPHSSSTASTSVALLKSRESVCGLMFGGVDVDGAGLRCFFDDVWVLDIMGEWVHLDTSISVASSGNSKLLGRMNHTSVYCPSSDSLLVFGGRNEFFLNDLWQLTLFTNSWKLLSRQGLSSPSVPTMRYGHSAIFFDDNMFIFGGFDCNGNASNELYVYSVVSNTWSCVTVQGEIPPRYYHGSCEFKGNMFIFGGLSSNGHDLVENVLWKLNLRTFQWSPVIITGDIPASRWGFSHALDLATEELYIFGGTTGMKANNCKSVYAVNLPKGTWRSQAINYSTFHTFESHSLGAACILRNSLVITGGQVVQKGNSIPLVCLLLSCTECESLSCPQASLGNDVLRHIFSFLKTAIDLSRCGAVCKQWYHVACIDELWLQFLEHFPLDLLDIELSARSQVLAYAQAALKTRNIRKYISTATRSLQVVIVGDTGVGKTSLIKTLESGSWCPSPATMGYEPNTTVFLDVDGTSFDVTIWDTAAQDDSLRLRPLVYLQADLFFLMVSVDRHDSLIHMHEKWIPEIIQNRPHTPLIVVASKVDLRSDTRLNCLSTKEIRDSSRSWILPLPFYEVSAMSGTTASLVTLLQNAVRHWVTLKYKNSHTNSRCLLQ
ncbi:hypothetical protein Pelo_10193 [Pelomyxa schiedti]|nr:hypothetical protein Pelo_10193 [Pelomyxa schiedti]